MSPMGENRDIPWWALYQVVTMINLLHFQDVTGRDARVDFLWWISWVFFRLPKIVIDSEFVDRVIPKFPWQGISHGNDLCSLRNFSFGFNNVSYMGFQATRVQFEYDRLPIMIRVA